MDEIPRRVKDASLIRSIKIIAQDRAETFANERDEMKTIKYFEIAIKLLHFCKRGSRNAT